MIALSRHSMKHIHIVDNFYKDPYQVRCFAKELDYSLKYPTPDWRAEGVNNLWPGLASTENLKENYLDIQVSKILQKPVRAGNNSGFFRLSKHNDLSDVFAHTDGIPDGSSKKSYQGIVYLSLPEHCLGKTGTVFLKHQKTELIYLQSSQDYWKVVEDYKQKELWEVYFKVENIFNRFIIFENMLNIVLPM